MAKPPRTGLRIWDRIVLLTAWLLTCGFVYLLGFYTGKGTQERRLGLEERVVRLPVTSQPPAEGQRPKPSTDLTFYEKLVSGAGGGEGSPAAKPAPPNDGASASPPPSVAKSATATSSTLALPKAAAAAPALPRVAAVPTPPTPSATLPPPGAGPPKAPPPPASASASPPVPSRPASGWWTVTANPTRERAEAEDLLYRLKGRGYPVTLVRVLRDGDTWYRLQIGRFASAEQANEMMRRLRDQEGVAHAFVASE